MSTLADRAQIALYVLIKDWPVDIGKDLLIDGLSPLKLLPSTKSINANMVDEVTPLARMKSEANAANLDLLYNKFLLWSYAILVVDPSDRVDEFFWGNYLRHCALYPKEHVCPLGEDVGDVVGEVLDIKKMSLIPARIKDAISCVALNDFPKSIVCRMGSDDDCPDGNLESLEIARTKEMLSYMLSTTINYNYSTRYLYRKCKHMDDVECAAYYRTCLESCEDASVPRLALCHPHIACLNIAEFCGTTLLGTTGYER